MKKILLSVGVLVAVGAVVAGATGAFFNDTETSSGNIFVAGDIDLKIDSFGSEYNDVEVPFGDWVARNLTDEKYFTIDDVKPGDFGWRHISLHVQSNPAWVCLQFVNKEDDENVVIEPELDAGDTTDDGVPYGELSQELELFAWEDALPDAIYDPNNETALMGGPESFFDVDYITYADSGNSIEALEGFGDVRHLTIAWCAGTLTVNPAGSLIEPGLPGSTIECDGTFVGDVAQTDIFSADVVAFAEQTRNNESFLCSSLAPEHTGQTFVLPGDIE